MKSRFVTLVKTTPNKNRTRTSRIKKKSCNRFTTRADKQAHPLGTGATVMSLGSDDRRRRWWRRGQPAGGCLQPGDSASPWGLKIARAAAQSCVPGDSQ